MLRPNSLQAFCQAFLPAIFSPLEGCIRFRRARPLDALYTDEPWSIFGHTAHQSLSISLIEPASAPSNKFVISLQSA